MGLRSNLSGLAESTVTVTIEVETEIPDGAPDKAVRDVTENCLALIISSQGFEKD